MLGGQFCTESAYVPKASEDVRVCCWQGLGDEAEQRVDVHSMLHGAWDLQDVTVTLDNN